MNNIDVILYIKNITDFFEKNPTQLFKLIGSTNKKVFEYEFTRYVKNKYNHNGEYVLTKMEFVEFLYEFNKKFGKVIEIHNVFENINNNRICLN